MLQGLTMPRPRRTETPDKERKNEQARLRMQKYRASSPNLDKVRRALVAAAATLAPEIRETLLNAMLASVEQDASERPDFDSYREAAVKLLDLPADEDGPSAP